jgi:hypothetical protein
MATSPESRTAAEKPVKRVPAVALAKHDREEIPQIALIDTSTFLLPNQTPSATDSGSRASYEAQAATRAARDQRTDTMGLDLPEPGPMSAIFATVALAAFVLVRRLS